MSLALAEAVKNLKTVAEQIKYLSFCNHKLYAIISPKQERFMHKLRIGLIGLGTVGTGVYKSAQSFDNIEIVKIYLY